MNSSEQLRRKLLGLLPYHPWEGLAREARFHSDAEHLAFLEDSRDRPEPFWSSIAGQLRWRRPPSGVGGPSGWFPGGELNLAEACLSPLDVSAEESSALCQLRADGSLSCLTRAALSARVDEVEGQLLGLSLAPGDRVFLALPDRELMLAALLACLRRGLTCVPQNPRYPRERLERRFEAAGCVAELRGPEIPSATAERELPYLVLDADQPPAPAPTAPPQPLAVAPMHPAFVLADSTGQLFTLPSAGFLVQALSSYRYILDGRGGGDLLWVQTPAHHASTLSATLGALAEGDQVGLLPEDASREAAGLVDAMATLRPRTILAGAKQLVRAVDTLTAEGARPRRPGPAVLIIEGEMLEPRIYRAIHQDLLDGQTHIVQVLSRPESGGFVAGPFPPITPVRPSSVGLPAPGLDLTVVNTKYEEVPPHRGGLLALRRAVPGLALELQRLDPPLALEVKARADAEGHLWTMGEVRVGHARVRRVASRELEAAFATIAGVEQVVVLRHRDAEGVENTTALVKPEDDAGVDLGALRRMVEKRFSADAMPESFKLVRRLPYSRSGKLLRSVLKRLVSGEPLGPDHLSSVADPSIVTDLIRDLEA